MTDDHTPHPDDAPGTAREREQFIDDWCTDHFRLPADVADELDGLDDDSDWPDPPARNGDPATAPPSGTTAGGEVPVTPVNWNVLTAAEAHVQWLDLDAWVTWLRHSYGLGVTTIPPLWHRHWELVWELSALHTAWLATYETPNTDPYLAIAWHRDFAEARHRLQAWVAQSGTKLKEDTPTRVTAWPGEPGYSDDWTTRPAAPAPTPITDRAADFAAFVADDLATRSRTESAVEQALAGISTTPPGHGPGPGSPLMGGHDD